MLYFLKKKFKQIFGVCLLIIIDQIFLVVSAIVNANALNALIALNWKEFIYQELVLLTIWGVIIISRWIISNLKMIVIQNLDIEIRNFITNRISKSDYELFHENSLGTYASWLNNDIQLINKQCFENFFDIVKGISGTIFSIIVLSKYHWSLTLVTMIALTIMLSVPKIFSKNMQRVSLNTTKENEKFLSKIEDSLHGFDVLLNLNLLKIIVNKIKDASLELKKVILKQTRVEAAVAAVGFSCNILFQILLTAFTGFLAFNGIVPIGTIEATGALTGIIFNTLGALSNQLSAINGTKPIFKKFSSLPILSRQVTDFESSKYKLKKDLDSLFIAQNLSFGYNELKIFNNLSFEIKKNKKYLITGPSGCGKSTLFRILNGYFDDYSGSLKFNGHELKNHSKKELRNQVLYLDQKPYLFSGTVRDNILLSDTYSDEEIIKTLNFVGLKKELENIDFLNLQVGDNGRNISGGQRQRIALARGLIRNRKIILLDEGTSAVDEDTSIEIEKNLLMKNDLTVIMITHNPHKELFQFFHKIINFPNDFTKK